MNAMCQIQSLKIILDLAFLVIFIVFGCKSFGTCVFGLKLSMYEEQRFCAWFGILMSSLPRKVSFLKQSNLVILSSEPLYSINVGL